MAKITDKEFWIAGERRNYGIWYTETDKFFIKDFDEQVAGNRYTYRKFGAGTSTMHELLEKVNIAIKEYETRIAELRKVIIIDLTAAKAHLEKYLYSERDYSPEWLNHIHASNTYDGAVMGFYITYEVKMFRIVGDRHEFFDITKEGKLINQSSVDNLTMYQIIDWSLEKQDALNRLYNMFQVLLDKFITSMKNPEQFIDAINQQKLLK